MITQGTCKHVVVRGSNRGNQCGRSCKGEYCAKHKPEQMEKQKQYLKAHYPYTKKNDSLKSLESQVTIQKEQIQMLGEEVNSTRMQMHKQAEDNKAKFDKLQNECAIIRRNNEELRNEQKLMKHIESNQGETDKFWTKDEQS